MGLGSLRLLSPMYGRYYGEKTRAVCSSMGGLQGGDDEAAESGTEMIVRLGGIWVVGVGVGVGVGG